MKNTITETAKKVITCVRRWLECVIAEIKSSYSHLKKGEFNKSLPLLMAGVLLVTVLLIVIISAASPSSRKTAENDILSEGQTYQTLVSGDYEYYIDADRAVIVSYKGWEEKLTVPAELDGLPVLGIGDGAFDGSNVKRVTVSDGIEFIGKAAFSNCTQMVSIDLPDSLTKIGNYCFMGCSGLEYLYIPQNVTELDTNSFENCPSLLGFTVDEANEKYRSINGVLCYDVSYDNDPDIYLGDSPEYIDRSIIRCPEKMAGDFSMSCVMSVYSGAFKDCVNITSITISGSLNYGCDIDAHAFEGCTSLEYVELDEMVLSIGDGAFASCPALKKINVSERSGSFTSVDGVLFNADGTRLVCYPANAERECTAFTWLYFVPSGVQEIAPYAFNMCSHDVYISDGVITIGEYAFSNMQGASCVTLPDSVVNIASNAFEEGKTPTEDENEEFGCPDGAHWFFEPELYAEDINVLSSYTSDKYTGSRGVAMDNGDLIAVKQNGFVGLVDYNGKNVVPALIHGVSTTRESGYVATDPDGSGYLLIDSENNKTEIHEINYFDTHNEYPFTGTSLCTPIWCELEQKLYVSQTSDYYLSVADLKEFDYSGVTAAYYFESLDALESYDYDSIYDSGDYDYDAWYNTFVVISNGKRVSKNVFEDAGEYANGLIAMKKNGKWGYLDNNGKVVFDFIYDAAWYEDFALSGYLVDDIEEYQRHPYSASDGYLVLYKRSYFDVSLDEYALYRTDGTMVLDWSYMKLRPVHNGKLWAGYDDVWGVLELD